MTQFFFEQFLFYLAIILTLIAPGYFVLHFFVSKNALTMIERSILAIPISFTITTFTLLCAAYANVPITRASTFILLITVSLIIIAGSQLTKRKFVTDSSQTNNTKKLSKKHCVVIGCIVAIMCLTKGAYLVNTIFPTSTDLGHHMYWVQRIVTTGEIVPYSKVIVEPDNPDEASTSAAKFIGVQQIPDFIIGEHIIFAAIALLSGISVISAMPSLILFLIHMVSIGTIFILSSRIFKHLPYGQIAAIFVLVTIGILYAISGAQAKFVSGGVVGNILGNMLIASTLYFFVRSLEEKNRTFFLLGIILATTLLYTHHLSMFIFGYILITWIITFCLLNIREIVSHIKLWLHLLNWWMLIVLASIIMFIFFIHIPSYLDPQTISSSLGSPSKSTRVGIPLWQLINSSGMIRFLYGISGLVIFTVIFSRVAFVQKHVKNLSIGENTKQNFIGTYAYALIIAWTLVLLTMSLEPSILKVNILSTRIATYIIFPLAITAGFFLAWIIYHLRQKSSTLPSTLTIPTAIFLFSIIVLDGTSDNTRSLKAVPETQQAVQTFHNALYLKDHAPKDSWSLKDHNYIEADSWMKVFMANGNSDYSNPLSRGFFARYESKPRREHCTREMISKPASDLAKQCFDNLNIVLITVNSEQDAGQFIKNNDFIKIYENNELSTFYRR